MFQKVIIMCTWKFVMWTWKFVMWTSAHMPCICRWKGSICVQLSTVKEELGARGAATFTDTACVSDEVLKVTGAGKSVGLSDPDAGLDLAPGDEGDSCRDAREQSTVGVRWNTQPSKHALCAQGAHIQPKKRSMPSRQPFECKGSFVPQFGSKSVGALDCGGSVCSCQPISLGHASTEPQKDTLLGSSCPAYSGTSTMSTNTQKQAQEQKGLGEAATLAQNANFDAHLLCSSFSSQQRRKSSLRLQEEEIERLWREGGGASPRTDAFLRSLSTNEVENQSRLQATDLIGESSAQQGQSIPASEAESESKGKTMELSLGSTAHLTRQGSMQDSAMHSFDISVLLINPDEGLR
uniref:Uncharacterized protein n=1 Tax=Dunaliella tertiolecta TaxID=3047 RepID=A0A7S3R6M3_DUNTE